VEKQYWWQDSVVYQIYPISFKDSNGDGIGDLRGIIEKLDYLQFLGVDMVWLCPVYDSPNDDNGYDIRDYRQIMKEFGTMADWQEMIDGMHQRGIKLMMDLVVNHSSDEHQWFVESRKSKDNPYRDYYYWRQPSAEGKEPNNWVSYFSGSTWEFAPETDEYYLHLFTKKQPDLNWTNPKVRDEICEIVKYWMDLGIDGFRLDAITMLDKHPDMPSIPTDHDDYVSGEPFYINRPKMHDYLHELNAREFSKNPNFVTVGETPGVPAEDAADYAGLDGKELNMTYHFEHMVLDYGPEGRWDTVPWKLAELKQVLSKWQTELYGKAWNSIYLDNHDQPRMISRFGNDSEAYREKSGKMLATLLHFMQGTPYVYQGSEIGMTNVQFSTIDDYRDVDILNMYKDQKAKGIKTDAEIFRSIHTKGRDNARTPMQWDASANAGFNNGEQTWIKVNPNYKTINVENAMANPDSILYYYKKLIALRKQEETIVLGKYKLLLEEHPQLFVYTRTHKNTMLLIVLNMYEEEVVFEIPDEFHLKQAELVISNVDLPEYIQLSDFQMSAYEARVYKLISHEGE
jgi:oligo-1,6-glucosidase